MNLLDIKTIGICGIGQMGSALAIAFERAGYDVRLWARNEDKLNQIPKSLESMNRWCDENTATTKSPDGGVTLSPDLQQLDADADVIFDCIIEVMDEKVALLKQFAQAKRRRALFLSATSALPITEMAQRSGLDDILVGAHAWNPPHLIPVVEMVRGEQTDQGMLSLACDLMTKVGKIPIVCRDVPGFIGNRLLHAMWRESLHMIDEGVCTAEDIDKVTRLTFALRLPLLGPMENMDYVGLDQTHRLQTFMAPRLANNQTPAKCLDTMIDRGDLGVKSGRGFYDWNQRDIDEVIAKRDSQVVQQLKYLRDIGELPS